MERRLKIKRIMFLAGRRASNEMEVLLSKVLNNLDLENLDDEGLDRVLNLVSMNDMELRDILYGFKEPPEGLKDLVDKIKGVIA
ncbi:MAG: succinate dehydrogenase assembly factor 2 [candidate division WOR-3 bacterium]